MKVTNSTDNSKKGVLARQVSPTTSTADRVTDRENQVLDQRKSSWATLKPFSVTRNKQSLGKARFQTGKGSHQLRLAG